MESKIINQEIISKLKEMAKLLDEQKAPNPYYLSIHPNSLFYKMALDLKWEQVDGYFIVPEDFYKWGFIEDKDEWTNRE